LDCFGDPNITGKIGTDIEDGKCTWLVVQAISKLEKAGDREGIQLIKDCYNLEMSDKVQIIKDLYEAQGLKILYHEYEQKKVEEIRDMISRLSLLELKPVFDNLLVLLLGRNK